MISTDGREGSKAPVVLRPVIIFRIDKWVVNSKGSYKFYMNCTSFHQFVCTADTELGMSAGDQAGIAFPVTTYDTSLVVIGLLHGCFSWVKLHRVFLLLIFLGEILYT